jgi:hypothetical protein
MSPVSSQHARRSSWNVCLARATPASSRARLRPSSTSSRISRLSEEALLHPGGTTKAGPWVPGMLIPGSTASAPQPRPLEEQIRERFQYTPLRPRYCEALNRTSRIDSKKRGQMLEAWPNVGGNRGRTGSCAMLKGTSPMPASITCIDRPNSLIRATAGCYRSQRHSRERLGGRDWMELGRSRLSPSEPI